MCRPVRSRPRLARPTSGPARRLDQLRRSRQHRVVLGLLRQRDLSAEPTTPVEQLMDPGPRRRFPRLSSADVAPASRAPQPHQPAVRGGHQARVNSRFYAGSSPSPQLTLARKVLGPGSISCSTGVVGSADRSRCRSSPSTTRCLIDYDAAGPTGRAGPLVGLANRGRERTGRHIPPRQVADARTASQLPFPGQTGRDPIALPATYRDLPEPETGEPRRGPGAQVSGGSAQYTTTGRSRRRQPAVSRRSSSSGRLIAPGRCSRSNSSRGNTSTSCAPAATSWRTSSR